MLLLQGANPYSTFRLDKLTEELKKGHALLRGVSARTLYLVMGEELTAVEKDRLIKILDKEHCEIAHELKQTCTMIVTPRFGTVSSWSSKATDILQVCGFKTISRIERGVLYHFDIPTTGLDLQELRNLAPLLHDKMTESVVFELPDLQKVFKEDPRRPLQKIDLLNQGLASLQVTNHQLGLALNEHDMNYLFAYYQKAGKNPTLAEIMMFAQVNSEHCRHKIFNAQWHIDGVKQPNSLFAMIRNTHEKNAHGVLSAYKDNAAILTGHFVRHFFSDPLKHTYDYHEEYIHTVIKVETHNHPTAIAPFAGAATGSGGEIRDEGATGIGAKPKAGLTGFSVSNLHIPNLPQPWELTPDYPSHVASSLDIMLQGPLGASSFNNEFGRPNLCGYFRTLALLESIEANVTRIRGYHKPIMIAGGLGQIRTPAIQKSSLPVGAKIIVLGGPSMLIGLGGGAASSVASGVQAAELDFASVQRSNPEMQRRCQEVINACTHLGTENPIISIHDVGAGGLSNAISELIHDSGQGGRFDLRSIPVSDQSLDAMQVWCNESQERYVLGIHVENVPLFEEITRRERCPYSIVGEVNASAHLELYDDHFDEFPVQLPLDILFGSASAMQRSALKKHSTHTRPLAIPSDISELIKRVLQLPCVSDKSFLITIGDRSVTGLVARDQMVGPWQIPVADVAVTASSFTSHEGEAMAMGERSPLALLDANASARMSIAEAITNILAADIKQLSDIKLSANWMAAADYAGEDLNLYEAVHTVGMELCPALGICIPVGKDSLSMRMKWQHENRQYDVIAPLSLVISAFSPVSDIRRTLTPQLIDEPSELLLIDLGQGQNRLGGSALAQVFAQLGEVPPDLDHPSLLVRFFNIIKRLREQDKLLAYHDRSDGGLLATLCEMIFAGHVGVTVDLDSLGDNPISSLFAEELGAVIQYRLSDKEIIHTILKEESLLVCCHVLGKPNSLDQLVVKFQKNILYQEDRVNLHRLWSQTSYHLKALRDNPLCAQQEYDSLQDRKNPGLNATLTFEIAKTNYIKKHIKPSIAVLREQGVNGHIEMAAAFDRAGFNAVDVHMTDIISGRISLAQFQGLAACGGFSYGDVLGAGRGWANSILYNEHAYSEFYDFFNRLDVFVLGVCNGCQMLSHLKTLIPGSSHWPHFTRNTSEQFEARLSLVKIRKSPSVFFRGMEESVLPIVVAHGEGHTQFDDQKMREKLLAANLVPLQYIDNYGEVTERYPANPNGSVSGITALTNEDGRFTLMMPHPERVFRTVQLSWRPPSWQDEHSPWLQIFINARKWLA